MDAVSGTRNTLFYPTSFLKGCRHHFLHTTFAARSWPAYRLRRANGVFVFYMPTIVFFVWILTFSYPPIRAIEAEAAARAALRGEHPARAGTPDGAVIAK